MSNPVLYSLETRCDRCGAQPIQLRPIPGPGAEEHLICAACDTTGQPEPFMWAVLKEHLPAVRRGVRLRWVK